jgi:dienelactone hydrolase
MSRNRAISRRRFVELSTAGAATAALAPAVAAGTSKTTEEPAAAPEFPGSDFLVQPSELTLKFSYPEGARRLSFVNDARVDMDLWRERCKGKLLQLLNFEMPQPCPARELRRAERGGISYRALVMQVSDNLSIPAYLLLPAKDRHPGLAVMAIQGHGEVEPLLGLRDEAHHQFALELARAGSVALAPAIRGFGMLSDLARGRDGYRLDYWPQQKYRQFTLATDSYLKGKPLIGTTVEDLLRWEEWLAREMGIKAIHSAGLSYGGDLALLYPVFSARVERIFASGTFGSFAPIFERCYNAPAHCIPNVLEWMDRADIAGLNAPRPIALHYGELDVPSPTNASAAYNETVPAAVTELKAIYARAGAEDRVKLLVTRGKGHEMDIAAMLEFLA